MSYKHVVRLWYYYALCILIFSFSLFAAEPLIPQQVLDWQTAAQTSVKEKNIPQAISYYEQIASSFPDTSFELDAKTQIICLEIRTKQDDKVQTDIQSLKQNYSFRPDYLKAIQTIGSQFRKSSQCDNALRLYQQALEQYPDHEQSVFLKRSEVIIFLEMKKRAEADSAMESLMATYKTSSGYAKAVWDISKEYRDTAKDGSKTRSLCTHLLEIFGQNTDAYLYQCTIIRTYLKENNLSGAGSAIDTLLNTYQNPDVPKQVVDLGWIYLKECKNPDKSIELCKRLLSQFPNDPQALRMRSLLTISLLQKGDFVEAGKEADILLSHYNSQHPDFVGEISDVGGIFRASKQNDKAIQVFEEILKCNPPIQYRLRAHTELGRIYASRGEDLLAQEKINLIYSDFKTLKGAARSIFAIGNEYYLQADELIRSSRAEQAKSLAVKAQQIWETLLLQLPGNDHAAETTLTIGYCYIIHGDFEKAIEHSQKVLQTWPGSEVVPEAYILIAQYLEKTITPNSANTVQNQIDEAYKTIIERYPKSKYAIQSMYALGGRCMLKENYQDGIIYYEQFVVKSPNDSQIPAILLQLGEAYEKTGNNAKAKEIYTLLLQKISTGGIYEQVRQKLQTL